MKNNFFRLIIIFIMMAFSYTGCTKIVQDIASNVQYELIKIDVQMIQNTNNAFNAILSGNFSSLSKAKFTTYLKIINNNDIELSIDRITYEIYMNKVKIGDGAINSKIVLKAKKTKILQIPVEVSINKILKNQLDEFMKNSKNNIEIIGKNYLHSSVGNFVISFIGKNNKIKITSIKYN